MKIALNLESLYRADETDRVSSVLRDMFTRDLLKVRLQRMDEAGLKDYLRSTKEIPLKKTPLIKRLKEFGKQFIP